MGSRQRHKSGVDFQEIERTMMPTGAMLLPEEAESLVVGVVSSLLHTEH